MAELDLTQQEADQLIALEKQYVGDEEWDYPSLGGSIRVPLVSADRRENFSLDVSRGRIDLEKGNYQNRGRKVVVLVRLDFGGQPHRNPDGAEVPSPHLHLFREGFGDKWAVSAPADVFGNLSDLSRTLDDFMAYCAISKPPVIRRGLFT